MASPLEIELRAEAARHEALAKVATKQADKLRDAESVARIMFTTGANRAPEGYQVLTRGQTVRVGSVVKAETMFASREAVVIGFGITDWDNAPTESHISRVARY